LYTTTDIAVRTGLGLLVREKNYAGYEDKDCAEDEEQCPRLISIDLIIENLKTISIPYYHWNEKLGFTSESRNLTANMLDKKC
jgi:hypothetical protein